MRSNNCNAYHFAIFIIQTNTDTGNKMSPAVVWTANRNRLVGTRASLKLSADGGLVLQDSDGSVVWSRGKTGNPIRRMNLTDEGNLLLTGESNQIIWRSFDEPTDSLLPGQRLALGKKLIPNFSERNWTENGAFSLTKKRDANEVEENYINQVPGLPMRFTYGYLKAVTDNFSGKLGEGGFGSVYEGTLKDGTRVAVRQLNRFDHVTRSFLAEMESMVSIHHLNLVDLPRSRRRTYSTGDGDRRSSST
ncbi:hypothetical protein MLD38_031417 [Melastoma candidum]|uniref:Uncharacterized protein n=1 Tax=Melastoma candidum TaxID=119954 RepID=A0ACB9MQV2_9MYRT|nr:hypothetical protein MLD38_031417 [Melastoma candidum]